MPRLAGKVVLITGGASGIGEASARAIVAEGGSVVIADLAVDAGRALAASLGDAAAFVQLDVTDRASWAAAVTETQRLFGRLDVLVNSAGMGLVAPIDTVDPDAFDRIIALNVTGTFNGIQAVIPSLRAVGGGSIVNISSVAGLIGYRLMAGYVTSKFAVTGLTKAAALDLAAEKIRVNSVHPGFVNTPMTAGGPRSTTGINPMGRAGEAVEIAQLVLFLASDESSYSTGAAFVADGGDSAGPDRMG